jgi:hypothetical protein
MVKIIRLDLFKLHDNKDNTNNWLLVKGKNLKFELKKLIEKTNFSNAKLTKYLIKKLNISSSSADRLSYLRKEWYPLIFIKTLVNLTHSSKYKIQDEIEFLKSCRPPVVEYKAVKKLTINLCKVVGAHAADGTLWDSFVRITDGHKSNILALKMWFNEFNYYPKLFRKGKNEYGIEFHSRIISRYLMKFFDFLSGCKQYTVKEPEIIRTSSLEFRKAFVLGALTFEAGVGIKNQVEFCVASKGFRDSIVDILKELNMSFTPMEKQSSNYWRFWSNVLTKKEAKKWMEVFEPNTEKWFKLKDYAYGYDKKVDSFDETVNIFNSVYPKQSSSKIILKDVLFALRDLKKTYRYELVDYLVKRKNLKSYGGKWASSLKHYLDIVKKANIIFVKKGRFGKKKSFGTIIRDVYTFNENVKEWRVPSR